MTATRDFQIPETQLLLQTASLLRQILTFLLPVGTLDPNCYTHCILLLLHFNSQSRALGLNDFLYCPRIANGLILIRSLFMCSATHLPLVQGDLKSEMCLQRPLQRKHPCHWCSRGGPAAGNEMFIV